MSLATLDARSASLDWCGVGNVESALFRATPGAGRAREALVCPGGVVGDRLPAAKVTTLPLRPRDVLVMATDGIREDFSDSLDLTGDVQLISDTIFARYAKGSDDALVLVARYLGADP
jgi:serine/threonine protein phosphatase PrpC